VAAQAAEHRTLESPPIPILHLVSTRGGNVRLEPFLKDATFKRYLVTPEFYNSETSLPDHALVVNAIGDADLCQEALTSVSSLLKQSSAPVINPPDVVMATGRETIARRLATVPGVRTARTLLFKRIDLEGSDAERLLSANGFQFPLLLRSPGFHGGEHFLRVSSAKELPHALGQLPGAELLVIEYLDPFWLDGKARKYRVMTIDGRLYPLHCAVSRDWKIHYFSADMADSPENRAEDAGFLNEMERVLAPAQLEALREIQLALGLDYGGIDFGIGRNDELLLFEANATMVILAPDPDPRWEYRRPAVERACAAVRSMLISRSDAHCNKSDSQ
jgi:glutathione synthase/RimK-type ligase-like ATP-grasp enzyme